MVQMRTFTWWNFTAIAILSLGIYYAFVWACNFLEFSNTFATIMEMHRSPLYYLTIGLCVMLCFSVDLFLRGLFFNVLVSPSDFLRNIVSEKLSLQAALPIFEKIYAKIKTQYVEESIRHESELEKRREELERLVKERNTKGG